MTEPSQIDCIGEAGPDYFRDWCSKLNAVHVKYGMLRQGMGRLPLPNERPNDYIWFETQNYGVIMSPVENGSRRFVLRV